MSWNYIGEPILPVDFVEDRPLVFLDKHYPGVTVCHGEKLTIKIKRETGTFLFEFDEAFTRGRLVSPKIDDMASGKILWNGVLTSGLFSKKDPVKSLLKLVKESRVVGEAYPVFDLEPFFSLVGPSSGSFFSSVTLRPSQENVAPDEIVLSKSLLEELRTAIRGSELWFLDGDQLYFELENEHGVKLVAKLSSKFHNQENVVLVSSYVVENLLTRGGKLTLKLVRVPIAKSLTVWIENPEFRTPEIKEGLLGELANYTVFTAGTRMKWNDVIYSVISAESWNEFSYLSVNAVTTIVPSDTPVEMKINYL
jgi:hypothetical protein